MDYIHTHLIGLSYQGEVFVSSIFILLPPTKPLTSSFSGNAALGAPLGRQSQFSVHRDVVKERWNGHLPISSHKARLGCWVDTGSQTSWSSLTCGEHKMSLRITPCSSCIVLCQNKVGRDIPIGNTRKVRSKLNGKGKEPPVKKVDNFSLPH